jgi:uncharacterized protein (DUF4213/DUF364 family)
MIVSIKTELLELTERTARAMPISPLAHAYIPEPDPDAGKHTEFGILALADGGAGLYYAWLGDSQRGMSAKYAEAWLLGQAPLELARRYASTDQAECSIGLAAISAITQSLYARAGFGAESAPDTAGALDANPGDHLGMVGYFPSLVGKLRAPGVRLTVIEQHDDLVQRGENFEVTLDPRQLSACNKILITAATLLNDTLEGLLAHAALAERIVVLGPTAGFFPDPLFARGVTAIAGTRLIDPVVAIARQRAEQSMGDSARKFLLERDRYPGFEQLLTAVRPCS